MLVICRLLHKSLSQLTDGAKLVENVRKRLASLREKLLRRIDARFSHADSNPPAMLDNISSFSDVLRHYLHVRQEAIRMLLVRNDDGSSNALSAMRVYVSTLHNVRNLLPKQLVDLLLRLQARPLVDDEDVRELLDIDLDLDKRFLPEEIRNFIPWLRHDALQKPEVEATLRTWSNAAFSTFLDGFKTSLGIHRELSTVIELRTQILGSWLNGPAGSASDLAPRNFEDLRSAFNRRLKDLIENRADQLGDIGARIQNAVEHSDVDGPDSREDLWDMTAVFTNTRHGGSRMKAAIVDAIHGRRSAQKQVLESYRTWLSHVNEVTDIVRQLKEQKWNEDLEFDDDENELDSRGMELTLDDPKFIEKYLADAITTAFRTLQEALQDTANKLIGESKEHKVPLLLRVVRDIRDHLPAFGEIGSFGLPIVVQLHDVLARTASVEPLRQLRQHLDRQSQVHLAAVVSVWDGSPPRPVQPSPAVFGFLYALVSAMVEKGADLWTKSAVDRLKLHVRAQVAPSLTASISRERPQQLKAEGIEEVEDHADPALQKDDTEVPVAEDRQDRQDREWKETRQIQILFDTSLIQRALLLANGRDGEDDLDALAKKLEQEIDLPTGASDRLYKSVEEYWKRSMALFSLLVA
ncbi:MAG: hypothetical protein M1826_002685 [Phylliscum demangeonii]|nr:MAG: hypothetical protein M1826_002685 [Phylliscum demangeonii]